MTLDGGAATDPRASRPLIVGVGGTVGRSSSTERALRVALQEAASLGADTMLFGGDELAAFPHYDPASPRNAAELRFVDAVRNASGLIVASPGFHGGMSGAVKNALDLLEETRADRRSYLDDLPVGIISTAHGWQATGSTIAAIRAVVHALRGWPTPFAAAINSKLTRLEGEGTAEERDALDQLRMVGGQVMKGVGIRRTVASAI